MATMSASNKLPEIPMLEKVSGSVVRILGGNGGKFTLQGTNTYLVGTNPDSLILIDTAQGFPQWKETLSSYLTTNNLHIKTCILTHWHNDHVRGVPDLLAISPDVALFKNQTNKLDPDRDLTNYTIHDIQDGQRFNDGSGFEVEAVHCPGHTKDHMALLITKSSHADEVGRMFTGDNVLGHGTAVFEDLATYLTSLHVMKSRIEKEMATQNISGQVAAYPGHGTVVANSIARIDEYIKHRKMREDEALNVLKYGSAKATEQRIEVRDWSSMDMVKIMYKDVPENLHVPAQMGLLMVLNKLSDEGRVLKSDDDEWRLVEKSTL